MHLTRLIGVTAIASLLSCMPAVADVLSHFEKSQVPAVAGTARPGDPVPYWCWTAKTRDIFKSCAGGYVRTYVKTNVTPEWNDDETFNAIAATQIDLLADIWAHGHKEEPPVPTPLAAPSHRKIGSSPRS